MASMQRSRLRSLARRCDIAIVALAMLMAGTGLVVALDSSDQSDMSVSIVSNGDTIPMTEVPFAGSAGERRAPSLPGTVTALLAVDNGAVQPATDSLMPIDANLMVTDDRGTAAGWDVLLSALAYQSDWAPVLMANRQETIRRIVPFASLATQGSSVTAGGTLGSVVQPTVVLQAESGTGAGMYVQRLVILIPSMVSDHPGTLVVQLPFAP